MPVIYLKLRAIFQPNGGCIDFFSTQMGSLFHIWILCLIKPDSDRIRTLEPFISQKMGYYTVYVSHLGFSRPASLKVLMGTLPFTLRGGN